MLLSCAGMPLCAFNRKYQGFVSVMLGIGLLSPLVYVIGLLLYKILPRLWNTCLKKSILCVLRAINCDHRFHSAVGSCEGEDDSTQDNTLFDDISGSVNCSEERALLYPNV